MTENSIRAYNQEDRDAFLSLFETVMGRKRGIEWFNWKYENNPYVDHVPMFVATADEKLVGARPFFALPVSVGDGEVALQPGDTMVHPDHRRKGLFTRMTEQAIERYEADHPFFFNFPNHRSRPGYLKLGWEIVTERSAFYRIQHPSTVAASRTDKTSIRLMSRIATPFIRAYQRFNDRNISISSNITVRVEEEIPSAELAQLYSRSVPDAIHAVRDKRFYDWRFNNPDWEYTTYLAESAGEPTAAIVAGQSQTGDVESTRLTEIVPLRDGSKPAIKTLLSHIIKDAAESDLLIAPPQGIPHDVLSMFGFHPNKQFPLSYMSDQTTHVVRGLDGVWERDGLQFVDPQDWHMTFVEYDTS